MEEKCLKMRRREFSNADANANAKANANGGGQVKTDYNCDPNNSVGVGVGLPDDPDDPDPFTSDLRVEVVDWPGIFLGTLLLVPWRAVVVVLSLVAAWAVSKIGLAGIKDGEESRSPREGWRRKVMDGPLAFLGRLILWTGGFRIRVVGRQASRKEAPLLVGAPHSSFMEAMIIVMCRCSPVSRYENKDAFLISACQKFTQTIFVDRRSRESRREAAEAISVRVRDPGDWPQVFVFPEGTNTNRRKLIKFKLGAFKPGVPVQPVTVRYGGCERIDPITWTFRQNHSYLTSVWLLLARPFNEVEVTFLPVYAPSPEEREDPELFAGNVQRVMARHLGVRASDVTYHEYYREYCRQHGIELRPRES